jgi:hypothetical protein
MMAAVTFSRRKIFSKVRVTEVVPAPDEPVMAMMGCLTDMVFFFFEEIQMRNKLRSANKGLSLCFSVGSLW